MTERVERLKKLNDMNKKAKITMSVVKPYGQLTLSNCEILPSRGRAIVLCKYCANDIAGREENGNGSELNEGDCVRHRLSSNFLKQIFICSGITFYYENEQNVFTLFIPLDIVESVVW